MIKLGSIRHCQGLEKLETSSGYAQPPANVFLSIVFQKR